MVAQALTDYYHEHLQYKPSAKHGLYHEKRLNMHFKGYFVSQVTQAGINAYVRTCEARKESNGTIRKDLEHLKAALNHEIREQRLVYAPKFKMPPPPPARGKNLTSKQIDRIKAACVSDHVQNFVILMMDTGQRPGMIEQLRWFQVDFKKKIIHFDLNGRAQSNKKVRPVPMSNEVYILLKKLFKAKKTEYVLEYLDTRDGKVKPSGCVKKAFARACERAGVDASRYTLRHTFANMYDMDEKTRSDFMGHTNQKTTREHYIKTNMGKMRTAINKAKRGKK